MQTHLILRFINIVRTPEGAVERWQPLGLSVDEDVLWKVGGRPNQEQKDQQDKQFATRSGTGRC